jgi:hypothetical protein
MKTVNVIGLQFAVVALLILPACGEDHGASTAHGAPAPARHLDGMPVIDPNATMIERPELVSELWECSECHDPDFMETDPTPRELGEDHDGMAFHHGDGQIWCLDCHDADDRDMLHLASGELVPFEESHRLCAQCHGDQYRDWRAGVHGKRTGSWNGEKQYLSCAGCHTGHTPRFEPIKPEAAPQPPEVTK